MAKIQNISEIHPTLGFTEFDILENYRKSFNKSELGRFHSVFPFECMVKASGLSEQRLMFCTKYGISPSFVRKGRAVRNESLRKILRSELSRERATRLEGSFGTQKQYYSLSRIKARNRKTEILWIFFGIHTTNAVLMIDRIRNRKVKAHDGSVK